MLGKVNDQLLIAVGEKPFNFRSLVYLYVPQQHLILEVPDFELLGGVCDEQMRGE